MSAILMILAFVLLLLAGLISAGKLSGANPRTLLYFGLASWALAVLVGAAAPYIERWRKQ